MSPLRLTAAVSRRSGAARIARRGLSGIFGLLASSHQRDANAESGGFLQGIDPRAKTVSLIGLIFVTTLVHSWLSLALCLTSGVFLALASNVPGNLLARAWLAVPLFTLLITLPATLNIVTPGHPLLVFPGVHLGKGVLAITAPGVVVAVRMAVRTGCCVTFALLLASTTRADRLFKGLRMLGMPSTFVTVLAMMERYTQVLARVAGEMHMAKISRTIEDSGLRREHEWVAAGMGSLFRRSRTMIRDVQSAMVSRGYKGENHTLDGLRAGPADYMFVAGVALFAALLLGLG